MIKAVLQFYDLNRRTTPSRVKWIVGTVLILFFGRLIFLSVRNIWAVISSGGHALFESEGIDLLDPVLMLMFALGWTFWVYWRDGPDPPQHEDLRKRNDPTR